jgi:hypothetical protein
MTQRTTRTMVSFDYLTYNNHGNERNCWLARSGPMSRGGNNIRDTYIPGYLTAQGELLVPIDTLQRDIQYTIIEDPKAQVGVVATSAGNGQNSKNGGGPPVVVGIDEQPQG